MELGERTHDPATWSQVTRLANTISNQQLALDEKAAAINDPNLPDHLVLRAIALLNSHSRLSTLAACERSSVLDAWGVLGNAKERAIVAFNPHTSAVTLRQLASDPVAHVRKQICFNPNAEPDVLAELLLDPSSEVQDAVQCAFGTDQGHHLRSGSRTAVYESNGVD
jgi:hypothetical protein